MAKTKCCQCRKHTTSMTFVAGAWWCSPCYAARDKIANPKSGLKFLGLPSTERLRTGLIQRDARTGRRL